MGGIFKIFITSKQYLWQVSLKVINVEVLIRHIGGENFSKGIRFAACLSKTSEYLYTNVLKLEVLNLCTVKLQVLTCLV